MVVPVLAADLTGGADARRWPVFAQRAVELGVRAVFSVPLGSDAVAIGSLDLYRRSPGPLTPRDTAGAFTASDAITLALMRAQAQAEDMTAQSSGEPTSWLDAAESGHEEVHYATGMLMVQLGVDPQQALARLRAYAYTQGVTATEAAREVLARRVEFDE
ncbi:ANTAR domain-containing protein [Streptomyces sp. NPDC005808]|uniref:ANTAR domain-containing protein n=1 Tax=Streptomyces sp. NPDC005808 TaxID=3364734 RepID=UPI0036A0B44F